MMADELKESKVIPVEYAELQLGEKLFRVPAAGLRRSELWRARLQVEINAILALLREQGGVFEKVDLGNLKEVANMGLVELIPVAGAVFAQINVSMASLADLICMYHPDLEQEQDYIEEHATTRQAIFALMEFVKLEYPFGLLTNRPKGQNGQEAATTSPNSHGLPGTSRRKR